MKKIIHLTLLAFLLLPLSMLAQDRNCATVEVLERLQQENPELINQMNAIERHTENYMQNPPLQQRQSVVIPVVVHVVYRYSSENISDQQIKSQIDVLNADFNALNGDLNRVPEEFRSIIGNVDISFCLADTDPNGNATTGITRKRGSRFSWGTTDRVKRSRDGGTDPWNPAQYLNIWVCNIGNGILGYAQFPGGPAATDGVVIDYKYFGTIGARSPFNRGRTTTHEVGHWLNLRHIWGDTVCGTDFVDDTPTHYRANTGCPTYPKVSECNNTTSEMTMNYMDYTHDGCMQMFSQGQATRMQATFAPGGPRYSLLNSKGCSASGGNTGGGGNNGGDDNEPPTVTCDEPTNLRTSQITTSSALLRWDAEDDAGSYSLRYRETGTNNWTNQNLSTTSFEVTNLTDDTQHEFQVRSVCENLQSSYTNLTYFTTEKAIIPANCDDVYEYNDSRFSASPITVNTTINAMINTSSDDDWFEFENTSSQRNIQIDLTNLPADYDVRLYRGSRRVALSQNYNLADEQITYNTSTVSTYTIWVYGYRGAHSATDCYELKVTLSGSKLRENARLDNTDVAKEDLLEETESITLFPNPASSKLNVEVPVLNEEETHFTLYDMTGKVVLQSKQALALGDSMAELNISALANGVYIVRVQNGDFIANRKFVINR